MSSSMFIERSAEVESSDSNLVVVYGKNGINFDKRSLQKIIGEKTISTISVVRLTSPTPSMKDEEEAERLAELAAASDESDIDSDAKDASDNDENSKSDKDQITGDDNSQDEHDDFEDEDETPKVKKRPGRKPKIVKKQKKRRKPKDRPEIAGLTVEHFYTDDIANELVKSSLKVAGVPTFRRTAETDALLEGIRNDHNYTPYTSPEQMRAQKAAERLEAEQRAAQQRKLVPHISSNGKQLSSKKKLQLQQTTQQNTLLTAGKEKPNVTLDDPISTVPKSARVLNISKDDVELIEDDEDINSSTNADDNDFAEGDNTNDESEISGDSRLTDNDRESDIDFNVNNRHQAKRKRSKKLKKNAPSRIQQQQHLNQVQQRQPQQVTVRNKQIQEQPTENVLPVIVKSATLSPIAVRSGRATAPSIVTFMPLNKTGPSPAAMLNKQLSTLNFSTATPTSPSTSAAAIRRTPIVQVGVTPSLGSPTTSSNTLNAASNSSLLLASPQEVKEIIINKNLNSPKGVFTNLNTLLNENTKTTITTSKAKKPSSIPHINPPTNPLATAKGFTPLGVDTASSKLPVQISIQTHQSSFELAAENERQLDLIDSIVQDEMQKSFLIEQETTSADENIPKLVKMLESTAEVLDQQNLKMPTKENTTQMDAYGTNLSVNDTAAVDNIDIANAPLLDTPDDDITADFLQHVVGLIEEDKQFKEVVEKEVIRVSFNNEANIVNAGALLPPLSTDNSTNILPKIVEHTENTNSDIKFDHQNLQTTSNIDTNVLHDSTQMATSTPIHARTIANAPIDVRPSEPIQIVRGNGRVITLPPIEAPTTRAKRRAQVTPSSMFFGDVNNSAVLSESSLDGSVYSNASYAGNENTSLLQLSSTKKPEEGSSRRQISSKDNTANTPTTTRVSRNRNKATKKLENTSQAIDTEASETQDDDDDPKKLWCVCRQPHNNRFMICCDVCEDWFHGTCVNITKAMGRAMELKKTDWTCPNCKQKQEEKKQPRITDMFQNNPVTSSAISSDNTNSAVISTDKTSHFESADQRLQDVKTCNVREVNAAQTQRNQTITVGTKRTNQPLKLVPASIQSKKIESNSLIQKSELTPLKVQTKALHQQQLKICKIESSTNSNVPCIVCKQLSKQNSIYCSDECIRKYAHNAVQMQQSLKAPDKSSSTVTNFSGEIKKGKKKDLFEDMLLLADSVKKVERINVFDRKTGRVIFGQQAPTVQNLKKWLQDNPTFEVVQPGSNEANEIEKRLSKRVASSTSPTVIKSNKSPVFKTSDIIYPPPVLTSKVEIQDGEIHSPQPIKALSQQQPQTISPKVFYQESQVENKIRGKPVKQSRLSNSKKNYETSNSTQKPEPIRLNVRRTLKEQLLLRIRESEKSENKNIDSELSTEDVETFAKNVESEMYNLFGKDTGAKYRAKYRSLMFNIKDRKNQKLFTKICAKQIVPKQLVRMTPEELASQELAKWRENENKHQLEMIKKSELDLLSCTKNYVLKTHKGEEVIESKTTDCVNLDLTIPVEDVVSVLNNSCVINNETLDNTSLLLQDNEDGKTAKEITEEPNKTKEYKPISSLKEKDFRDKEKDRDKKSKSNRDREHRHRSRGKSHSRKRSRSRSRSRSHEKRHKSISHRNERHQRSRDKDTSEHTHQSDDFKRDKEEKKTYHHEKLHTPRSILDQENERTQSGEDYQFEERHEMKVDEKNVNSTNTNKKVINSSRTAANKEQHSEKAEKLESCNLVDKILQSVKTVEEAANLVKSKEHDMVHGEQKEKHENPYTKSQNVAAIWNGEINMVDVACFNVKLQHISGNTEKLGNFLNESSEQFGIKTGLQKIEVVGRISRDTVWEYVAKIKKSPTKEIAIVSLSPSGESEKEGYKKLYEYLDSRQRLGVIGVACEHIRDFYIYPLGALKRIPLVLQTTETIEFCEDSQRSNILIGIIIRCITTRAHLSSANLHHGIISSSSSTSKLPKLSHKLRDTNSFISKRRRISHNSKDDEIDIDAIIKTPIAAKSQRVIDTTLIAPKNDGDEPYSPGDSSDDDVLMLSTSAGGGDKDELKRKVEEINKQIAAQRKEIAGLLNVEPSNLKMHTTSSSVLANISIPPNLSTILASIKDKTDFNRETPKLSADEEYNPEDAIVSCSSYGKVKLDDNTSSLSHNSRLAQLSEAELLSMVPDDLIAQSPLANNSEEPPPPGV